MTMPPDSSSDHSSAQGKSNEFLSTLLNARQRRLSNQYYNSVFKLQIMQDWLREQYPGDEFPPDLQRFLCASHPTLAQVIAYQNYLDSTSASPPRTSEPSTTDSPDLT